MKLTICDLNPWIVRAFASAFADEGEVDCRVGNILTIGAEALITPGNSYGLMDGGIDLRLAQRFDGLQERVQERIAARPLRELLVGEAVAVALPGEDVTKWVIYAPTMRVPRPISDPYDIRLAARAAFKACRDAGIRWVAMPGLGTLTGQVAFDLAAAAVAVEWRK